MNANHKLGFAGVKYIMNVPCQYLITTCLDISISCKMSNLISSLTMLCFGWRHIADESVADDSSNAVFGFSLANHTGLVYKLLDNLYIKKNYLGGL